MVQELIKALEEAGAERGRTLRFMDHWSFAVGGELEEVEKLARKVKSLRVVKHYFETPRIGKKSARLWDVIFEIRDEFKTTDERQADAQAVLESINEAFKRRRQPRARIAKESEPAKADPRELRDVIARYEDTGTAREEE